MCIHPACQPSNLITARQRACVSIQHANHQISLPLDKGHVYGPDVPIRARKDRSVVEIHRNYPQRSVRCFLISAETRSEYQVCHPAWLPSILFVARHTACAQSRRFDSRSNGRSVAEISPKNTLREASAASWSELRLALNIIIAIQHGYHLHSLFLDRRLVHGPDAPISARKYSSIAEISPGAECCIWTAEISLKDCHGQQLSKKHVLILVGNLQEKGWNCGSWFIKWKI